MKSCGAGTRSVFASALAVDPGGPGVPVAHTENLLRAHDEAGSAGLNRPGWLWLTYILFGAAFWAGIAIGIRALLAAF